MENSMKEKVNTGLLFRIIFSSALVFALIQNIPGPLIPVFVEEFGIGYDEIGLIFFVGLFFGLISATLFGRLSDSISRRLIMITGIIILLTGTVGIVFSYIMPLFIIFFCMMNIGLGCLEAGMTTAVSELGKGARSHSLTVYTAFLGIGAFLGPVILFFVLYFDLWWRLIYILTAVLFLIPLILFFKTNYPEKNPAYNPSRIGYRDIARPAILYGALAVIFHNGVIIIVGTWLTTYLLAFDLYIGYSSILLAFYWIAVILGRLITQKAIKIINERLYLVLTALLATVSMAFIAFSSILIVKIIFTFILGVSLGGVFPLIISNMFSVFPAAPGRIFSILGFIGYGAVMIFQLITGFIAERFGEEYIVYIQFGNSLLCLVFIILLVRSRKSETAGI